MCEQDEPSWLVLQKGALAVEWVGYVAPLVGAWVDHVESEGVEWVDRVEFEEGAWVDRVASSEVVEWVRSEGVVSSVEGKAKENCGSKDEDLCLVMQKRMEICMGEIVWM